MAWTSGKQNPLFVYPAEAYSVSNYGFDSALGGLGTDWGTGGTGTVARDTGVYKYGSASVKYTLAAQTGWVDNYRTLSGNPYWKTTGLEPWYVYFWLRCDSGTGTFKVDLRSRQSDHSTNVDAFTVADFVLGTDIAVDNTFYRLRAGPFTPTTYTNVFEMYVKLGFTSNTTATVYLDHVVVCHALDFQDVTGAAPYGAWIKDRLSIKKEYGRTVVYALNGTAETLKWNGGLLRISGETSLLNDADRTKWRTMWAYTNDRTPFTFYCDQTLQSRDYVAQAVHSGLEDGLTQYPGTGLHRAKFDIEEVI